MLKLRKMTNPVLVLTIFGAFMGVVCGLRPIDNFGSHPFYWFWLSVWIAIGAVLGASLEAVYGYVRHASLPRQKARLQQWHDVRLGH